MRAWLWDTERELEWNIVQIGADVAWQTTRGESVVVANIDSGVRQTHEAVRSTYRGYRGNDTAVHDYNWFDPKEFARDPWWCDPSWPMPDECRTDDPFDNTGHVSGLRGALESTRTGQEVAGTLALQTWDCRRSGDACGTGVRAHTHATLIPTPRRQGTHTMGTIAGTAETGIGVAPGVQWIAAKGCRDGSCLDYGLLASAEWVMVRWPRLKKKKRKKKQRDC